MTGRRRGARGTRDEAGLSSAIGAALAVRLAGVVVMVIAGIHEYTSDAPFGTFPTLDLVLIGIGIALIWAGRRMTRRAHDGDDW